MVKNVRHGKRIPILQSLLDIVLLTCVFVCLTFILDQEVIIERLRVATLTMLLGSMLLWAGLMATHSRRMLRAENLILRAAGLSFTATILQAAFMMFTGFHGVGPVFFAWLWGSLFVTLTIVWLLELAILRHFRRQGHNIRNVVIYGTGSGALKLAERLTRDYRYGYAVRAFFNRECPKDFTGNYQGTLDDMERYCDENPVDEIFYAASTDDDRAINRVIHIADANLCRFYIVPLMSSRLKMQFYMITLNGTIPAIGIHPSPLTTPFNRFVKRSFDILFAGTFLLISPIIFLPIAIAIKLTSPGPVLFCQKRTGYMGNEFTCYKFRTMKVNNQSDSQQASRDDDRKTKLGNFLRHTSLDELPQFYNVLRGDMSVVGPRPHMLAHTEEYRSIIGNYMLRHLVKPGITGWAQISGYRGATDELWKMEKRVDSDVWYIEHWSFLLDMKIIVKTVTNALHGEENAY